MSGQSKIERLPTEILHCVLRQLPLQDLKSFRLSRTLTKLHWEHIFNHVRVILHSESSAAVGDVAKHEQICEKVRSLSFDLRMVQHHTYPLDYHQWVDTCVQVGKRTCPDFRRKAAHANYSHYVNYVKDQHAIAAFGVDTLCSYFQRLPNIRHLEVTGGSGYGSEIPTAEDFNDFEAVWPRIGTAPSWKGNLDPEPQIVKVLTAGLRNG